MATPIMPVTIKNNGKFSVVSSSKYANSFADLDCRDKQLFLSYLKVRKSSFDD
jgi:hypothetical protein